MLSSQRAFKIFVLDMFGVSMKSARGANCSLRRLGLRDDRC